MKGSIKKLQRKEKREEGRGRGHGKSGDRFIGCLTD